ncbi:thermonuclease NucI [Staphylococcus pasteuri]|uniref:thermonuclease NucI n=1 Tax=Staphylococcus pasteuri TaxID=45972 RepID=UPI001AD86071|nr:thermonuclease family protein [Staphylococcus pasteuri]QQT21019.1 thermonuclease family protein [Staphylococcus pasteuri]
MKSKKSLSTLALVIIAIFVLLFQYINHSGPFSGNQSEVSSTDLKGKEKVHVERVVDGDTFVAKQGNKSIKVRLIGVDTPETVKPNTPVQPYGKEASNYSKKTLSDKDVYLEYDKEKNDRYGRTLAYVWLDKDHMFNKELVDKGLAREKYFAPNGKYRDMFIKAQNEVKKKKVNLWS